MVWDVPAPAIRTALHTSAIRLPWHRADSGAAIERAFSQQYDRHHQAIYRYCRSILRDDHEAHDALQSTMAKALVAMRAGTLTGDIRPWLFRVAHNECISMRRRGTPSATLESRDELGAEDLTRRVDDRAAIAQLRADLDDLAERPRTALVLREFSGLSHDEIARILDTTPGAVKQTIFEARRALVECQTGRAMSCDDVQRVLSDHDGRSIRSRKIRAHVRDCTACTAFLAAIDERPRQLALLAPALPAATGSALLGHVLSGGHAATGIGSIGAATTTTLASGAGIAGAGSALATSVGLKIAALAAATAVVTGGGAAVLHDRSTAGRSEHAVPATTLVPAAPATTTTSSGAGGPLGPGGVPTAQKTGDPQADEARQRSDTPPTTTPPAGGGLAAARGGAKARETSTGGAAQSSSPSKGNARGTGATKRRSRDASSAASNAASGKSGPPRDRQQGGASADTPSAGRPSAPAKHAPPTHPAPSAPKADDGASGAETPSGAASVPGAPTGGNAPARRDEREQSADQSAGAPTM